MKERDKIIESIKSRIFPIGDVDMDDVFNKIKNNLTNRAINKYNKFEEIRKSVKELFKKDKLTTNDITFYSNFTTLGINKHIGEKIVRFFTLPAKSKNLNDWKINIEPYYFVDNNDNIYVVCFSLLEFLFASVNKPWTSCWNVEKYSDPDQGSNVLGILYGYMHPLSMIIYKLTPYNILYSPVEKYIFEARVIVYALNDNGNIYFIGRDKIYKAIDSKVTPESLVPLFDAIARKLFKWNFDGHLEDKKTVCIKLGEDWKFGYVDNYVFLITNREEKDARDILNSGDFSEDKFLINYYINVNSLQDFLRALISTYKETNESQTLIKENLKILNMFVDTADLDINTITLRTLNEWIEKYGIKFKF